MLLIGLVLTLNVVFAPLAVEAQNAGGMPAVDP